MIHIVTGGSGSGKSAYAEDQILSFENGNRVYIATMYPFDEESFKRIDRHRWMRKDKGFETIECYTGLKTVELPPDSCVLLECMSNLVANEMYQEQGARENTVEEILEGVKHLAGQARELVIVTNEIFSHTDFYDVETRKYQQYLGCINQELAKISSSVTEVVYGIPVAVKTDMRNPK